MGGSCPWPMVVCAVVLPEESVVRGKWRPSPQAPPGLPTLSGLVSWVGWGGDRLGAVSCRARSPHCGHPLAGRVSLPSLPLQPKGWGCLHGSMVHTPPCNFGWPEEPEGQLGPGHLAHSVMTAGQGLGT